jgi:hypothetical protein
VPSSFKDCRHSFGAGGGLVGDRIEGRIIGIFETIKLPEFFPGILFIPGLEILTILSKN